MRWQFCFVFAIKGHVKLTVDFAQFRAERTTCQKRKRRFAKEKINNEIKD
jgi:hypothetical protein